jgi:hypothetical protein
MEASHNINHNAYFNELLKKFDFIQSVWVTDYEGALIANALREEEKENDPNNSNDDKQELDKNNKIKVSLSFQFNSAMDQIANLEKWKTKNFVTIYDTMTIFQAKINKSVLIHFICDSKTFNYEIVKEIANEVREKLQKVEKEIENLTQNNDSTI